MDEKKIEEAAMAHCVFNPANHSKQFFDGFKAGARWAIQEFLKGLWHPAEEEPKFDKQIAIFWGNGMAKFIVLNGEAVYYNITPARAWRNICRDYKVTRWLYIDDLLSKQKGDENNE